MKIRFFIFSWAIIFAVFLILPSSASGFVYINVQEPRNIVDTFKISSPDTLPSPTDTSQAVKRKGTKITSEYDSTAVITPGMDTTAPDEDVFTIRISKDTLEADVIYNAQDSIIYDILAQKILLYGSADVTYNQINLKAHFIEYDWKNSLLSAEGLEDSAGNIRGKPEFTERDQVYRSRRIVYNFKTQKGKIYDVITQEGEGFIHSGEVKKDENNNLYATKAKYTTCNLDHPHFWIEADPLKIIPDQVLVCGPANLVIEGVRTPLVLPFAIFPIKKGQRSGILPPEISNTANYGFGLINGGYYFGLSDNFDLQVRPSIYTSGSWRLDASSNFVKRYNYRGNLAVGYGSLVQGDKFKNTFQQNKDFKITGSFTLDPKAWPNNSLGASINIASSEYSKYNEYDYNNRFNNTYQSSINYSRSWPGKPFSLSAGLGHSQNTYLKNVSLRLPEVNFSVSRINPFESKARIGSPKWYEDIAFRYTMRGTNSITVPDSLLFEPGILEKFRTGIQHNIPVNTSFTVLKYFTVTPQFNYTENWFFETIEKRYDPISIDDSIISYVQTDTIRGFSAARYYNGEIGASTRIFGRVNFPNSKIKAIRHVLTPSFGFSFQPDFGALERKYYDTVTLNPQGEVLFYSRFPNDILGSIPTGRQGNIYLNLGNSLEMKVYSAKDTVNHERKIKILEAFNTGITYNLAADSLNINPINFSGRTTLFEKINLDFSGSADPYALADDGFTRINTFELEKNNRLLRFTNAAVNISSRFGSPNQKAFREDYIDDFRYPNEPVNYIVYNVPWNVSTRYTLRLQKGLLDNPDTIVFRQSLGVDLDFNISPQWRISVGSDYDFVQKEFTYANVEVYRDLHCWEMRFRWIPIGTLKSYSFGINVKSAILKDLKIEKKNNPLDNINF